MKKNIFKLLCFFCFLCISNHSFADVLKKIERLSEIKIKNSFKFDIEVDGGINFSNFKEVLKAGANVLVSGTTIFKENNGDIKKNINFLKTI